MILNALVERLERRSKDDPKDRHFEEADRSIEIERDVLELHCFLMSCVYALSGCNSVNSRPIFDFPDELVHAWT